MRSRNMATCISEIKGITFLIHTLFLFVCCLFFCWCVRRFLHLPALHHWPGPAPPSSPPQLAAASARPAPPWRAGAPPPAGSRRSDSPSSGRSVCGLSDTRRRRGSDSGRIWGSGSSCVLSADGAPETGTLYSLLGLRGGRTAPRIRQGLSRQQLPELPRI